MSTLAELTNLPRWVWDTVEALIRYEDEHPPLYRMVADGTFEGFECPAVVLACVPSEIADMLKVIRAYEKSHVGEPA